MRAITVRQPWAWAIAVGAKTVENRSQRTNYRGPLAIHAGLQHSERGHRDRRVLDLMDRNRCGARWPGHNRRPYDTSGAVVAVAELVDCHPDAGCCRPWGESSYIEAGGRRRDLIWHYVLADIRAVDPPISTAGRLGLWHVPTHIRVQLEPDCDQADL